MKTITIPPQAAEINDLLKQASEEDVLVRSPDGTEYVLSAVDDFDHELVLTQQNVKLMALLVERAKQSRRVPLDEVKRQLGLSE